MAGVAWLNGVFLSADEAAISPFDRGFLFSDGVYEVTAVCGGRLVDLERHLVRLDRSLSELGFPVRPDMDRLRRVHTELVARNRVQEGLIYLQVTRGAYGGRAFVPPSAGVRLTEFAFVEARPLIDVPAARDGIRVALLPDIRWGRRDIKTTQLLAATLAKTEAKARGADDAWLVAPDGLITEGASANAWIVNSLGELVTRALSHDILAGVTRAALLDAAAREGVTIAERSFTPSEAMAAREAWITGAGSLIQPVVAIDGAPVGAGVPGPVTRRLQRLYFAAIGVAAPAWAG